MPSKKRKAAARRLKESAASSPPSKAARALPSGGTYKDIVKENRPFEDYYGHVLAADDLQAFLQSLRRPLPSAVRVNVSVPGSSRVVRALSACGSVDEVTRSSRLSWFPRALAWQWTDLNRSAIRKDPSYRALKRLLVAEDERGGVSRQEAVSMLPALALDVRPGQSVLDLCAAPGSKTAQVVDMLSLVEDGSLLDAPHRSTAVVIGNDINGKRAMMLTHRLQRVPSPSLLVSCIDATFYPSALPKFDRVLADVPCSGDGTMRKAPDIWRRWTAAEGAGLHTQQLTILLRGLRLLKPGGRIVYSTCSLNPLENEAVVAAALRRDSRATLASPGFPTGGSLRCSPGLTSWKVPSSDFHSTGRMYSDPSEGEKDRGRARETLYPPKLPCGLERCCRFYPHLNDSGGFFVAVLVLQEEGQTDVSPPPPVEQETAATPSSAERGGDEVSDSRGDLCQSFLSAEDGKDELDFSSSDLAFFGLEGELPLGHLAFRRGVPRRLFLISAGVRERVFGIGLPTTLKWVHAGCRAFERFSVTEASRQSCQWRLAQEAVGTLFPLMRRRRLDVRDDSLIRQMLTTEGLLSPEALKVAASEGKITGLESCKDADGSIGGGSCVALLVGSGSESDGVPVTCVLVGTGKLITYVSKVEKAALMVHFFGPPVESSASNESSTDLDSASQTESVSQACEG